LRKREYGEKKRKPEPLANVLGSFLKESKLDERVEAAQVVPEWESLVGKQIATVTKPISVTQDGTLFVSVKTNGWMTELSLMEPQLLRALNAKAGRLRIRKIRLQLMR
jgi:predicted nucleic acid-binding Zn ribbon protein